MPTVLASDIIAEARTALLNDPNGAIYPDTPMLAVVSKVYKELQTKLSAHGLKSNKEITSLIPVVAGETSLIVGGGLDSTFLMPLWVGERASGASGAYREMIETNWEPDITPLNELRYWSWREDQLKFPAALTDRELMIRHTRTLNTISSVNSPIQVADAYVWMAQRVAVVAAITIGGNQSRADALAVDLTDIWDDLRAVMIKRGQSLPVRRRRTRFRRP